MSALLSILFAASLSSSYLDEFFTLPSWMPTTVSADDTPGSDPEWYVEEFTNRIDVVDSWRVSANGVQALTGYSIPYYEEYGLWTDCYLVEECIIDSWIAIRPDILHELRNLGDVTPQFVNGDGKEESLSFRARIEWTDTNGVERTEILGIDASRTNTVTPIATGKWKPKAARITPDVQAGIISTFAGYCERQYYASQGQSNVWDVSEWGPRYDKKEFWFAPTNQLYAEREWDYKTNRTIRTRRFIEYPNISSFCDFLVAMGEDEFEHSAPNRPGWISGPGNDRSRMWWSSTEGIVLTGTDIVPQFSWTENPTLMTEWDTCSQTFKVLDYDAVWMPNATNRTLTECKSSHMPSVLLMNEIGFGEGGLFNPTNCLAAYLSANVKSMIEKNFTHADGWDVTNRTRRLRSHALCNVNQMLGLMDRTYHVPEVVYPSVGTNTHFVNAAFCSGIVDSTNWVYDADNRRWHNTPETIEPTWGDNSFTNYISSWDYVAPNDKVEYGTTATETRCDEPLGSVAGMCTISADETIAKGCVQGKAETGDFIIILTGLGGVFQDFSPREYNVRIGYTVTFNEGTERQYSYSGFSPVSCIGPLWIYLYIWYDRSYDYAECGYPYLLTTQPGWEGFSRSESSFGAVIGRNKNYGDEIRYRSQSDTYSSRESLMSQFMSMCNTFRPDFVAAYGIEPTNWQQIIPINVSDFDRVKASVRVLDASATYASTGYSTWVYGNKDGDEVSISRVVSKDQHGVEEEGYSQLLYGTYTVYASSDYPDQDERDGLEEDFKIGLITRTDWSWKTLKRD